MTTVSLICSITLLESASLVNGQKHLLFVKISTCKPFRSMFSVLFESCFRKFNERLRK
jgi:hypothetical protein